MRPEIVTWEKLCEAIKASGKAYNMEIISRRSSRASVSRPSWMFSSRRIFLKMCIRDR